jgi:hypothetical protein
MSTLSATKQINIPFAACIREIFLEINAPMQFSKFM